MEKKKYLLLAEWGMQDNLVGLFPRIVEWSIWSANCPNRLTDTYAHCREEAIENFIKFGKIKRRSQSAIVGINGKREVSFYVFTDCIKRLAR